MFRYSKIENSNDIEVFKNCLPDMLIKQLEKTKWLNSIYKDESEEPETSEEISQFFEEITQFSNDLREYLKVNPINRNNLANYQNELPNFYGYEKCNGDKCMGLPEETEIFAIHQLMMCLRIAKIDGEWKIIQIFSVASE